MSNSRLFILCNALADDVRLERGITTDSPAATRKVAMMAEALREAGTDVTILSLGRGRQDGSGRYFAPRNGRIRGVPVIYGSFIHRPVISELLSLWATIPTIWQSRTRAKSTVLLIYNRMPAYVPAIWLARGLGYRVALDLEDGETTSGEFRTGALKARLLTNLIDSACTSGVLLACRALSGATQIQPQLTYYGVIEPSAQHRRFNGAQVNVLLGGTIARSTGADLLATAINLLRDRDESWSRQLHFHVSGAGESLTLFDQLAASNERGPSVTRHGRLDDAGYADLLKRMDVGLALKPNGGELAQTTFPSKVVEMASAGMLVLTTDISDVREVLGDGAHYLEEDDPEKLIERLRTIVIEPKQARSDAEKGRDIVSRRCAPDQAGRMLRRFLFAEVA